MFPIAILLLFPDKFIFQTILSLPRFTFSLGLYVLSESEVAQSCLTLSDPVDYSPPGPPSMGFSRQEYWSGVPLPSPLTAARHIIFTWSWYTW